MGDVLLADLLSEDECNQIVEPFSAVNWFPKVGAEGRDGRPLEDRKESCRRECPELCALLTQRLTERLQPESGNLRVDGPFRLIKYKEHGRISPHIDGSVPDPVTGGCTT